MNEKDQMQYVHEMMWEIDRRSQLRTARNMGREEGKTELAKKLKELGVPVETICTATGFDESTVLSL